MLYRDELYGECLLPDFLEAFVSSQIVQRLKHISQDTLPQNCAPWPVPDRFHHSMGVVCLANLVAISNHQRLSKREVKLLMISSLLHDAGNPPFSHLAEPFLEKLTKKNGESFLEDMVTRNPAQLLLREHGFTVAEIVRCVTGNLNTFSEVLHGSVDLDNLDNVLRYWAVSHAGQMTFNAQLIASSFRYENRSWMLDAECVNQVLQWRKTREAVYGMIYASPRLNASMMLYRAMEIAFGKRCLNRLFFKFNDRRATEFLLSCGGGAMQLVQDVLRRKWYQEVFSFTTESPSAQLKKVAADRDYRTLLANEISSYCHIPEHAVCVYIGKGHDKRKIDMPFFHANDEVFWDGEDPQPIYRVRVYVHEEFVLRRPHVEWLTEQLIH